MTGVRIDCAVADRGVEVALDTPVGTTTAIVGPNGAGKSTLLHLVAGLVRPSSGTVAIRGRVVADAGRSDQPHRRRAVLLTQQTALFPHMSVLDNVAFGPRAAGLRIAAAQSRAKSELDAVGCGDFADRRPHQLSGGQAQRVAMARALAVDPDVVLLDEPLAGLDITTAAGVRHMLRERLAGRTALLVTHEVLDVWTIADQVVVLEAGLVTESGATSDVLTRPTSSFLAHMGGTNLLMGIAATSGTVTVSDQIIVRGLTDPAEPLLKGTSALAAFSPSAVSLHSQPPAGSPRNTLHCVVVSVEPRGDVVRVHLQLADQSFAADLTAQAVAELGIRPGAALFAAVKATQVRLYGR